MPTEPALPLQDMDEVLQEALRQLFERERAILENDVNERTICAALAEILRPFFPRHSVHAEYNRRGIVPKEIGLPDADGNLIRNRVFPDIIVHQPGHDRENLLVIEVKKTTNNATDEADRIKLLEMRQQIGYRFAAFIRISAGADCNIQRNSIAWV